MNKRTNKNKKNYKLKKYIGGAAQPSADDGDPHRHEATKRDIREQLRQKEIGIINNYLDEQDSIIEGILGRVDANTTGVVDSLIELEEEWNKILEDKGGEMKEKLKERLNKRAKKPVYTDSELDTLANTVGLLSQQPSTDTEGKMKFLLKNARERLNLSRVRVASELTATPTQTLNLNSAIEGKVREIFTQELNNERVKLIIEYSHNETIIERLLVKGASLTGYRVVDKLMEDLDFSKLIDPTDMTPISHSFHVQFISCLIAIVYSMIKIKLGYVRGLPSITHIFISMFLITLVCYIALFAMGKILLIYFIIKLSMLLIELLRWGLTQVGILNDSISPKKSYGKLKKKTRGFNVVIKYPTRFIGGAIIAFDTLLRVIFYPFAHPQKFGRKIKDIDISKSLNKLKNMIGISVEVNQDQQGQPGQVGAGIKLGGSSLKSILETILGKYMELNTSEVPINNKIVIQLTDILIHMNSVIRSGENKHDGGYSNKKTKRKHKTKIKHKTKRRKHKTKRK